MKSIIAFVAFLTAVSSSATTYYYNKSEASDPYNGWTNVLYWSTAAGNTGDGNHPSSFSSGDEFVVPPYSGGFTLRTMSTENMWYGKCLRIGGEPHLNASSLAILRHTRGGSSYPLTYANDGLVLGDRSRYYFYKSDSTCHIYGTVTVESTSPTYAAQLYSAKYNNITAHFHDVFKGESNARLRIVTTMQGFGVKIDNPTAYRGTIICADNTPAVTLTLGNDFPGSLILSNDTTLVTAKNSKLNMLNIGEGVAIDASAGGFSVTGALESASVVTVRVNAASLSCAADFSFTSSTPLSSDKFAFVGANGLRLNDDLFDFVETPEGATVRVYPVVTLTTSDNKSLTEENPSSMTNSSHWTNAEAWPDSATMPGGCHYALSSSASCLRTSYSGTLKNPEGDLVFPGLSLTLPTSTCLVMLNPSFACTNLVLDGGQLQLTVYANTTCSGKMTITENGGSIYQYIRKTTIESEISGSGDLRITAASGSASAQPYGYVCLDALNTNYTGAITATIPIYTPSGDITTSSNTNKITPRFDRNYMHLQISDKRNLGGALAAVNPKALTIRNMSRLELADGCTSLVLDEPTRGIFVNWVGRFLADSGQTMTLASPLAVYGTMWKEGSGTLVLANPQPTFGTTAADTTPDADATNRTFRVEAGTVKIASGRAVNGLDVVVKSGASLALDLGSSDADLAAYGIRNELTPSVPFATVDAATVQLNLVLPDNYEPSAAVPVATVKATDADSVDSVLVVRKPTDGGGMRTLAKSRRNVTINETACVTFTVDTTAPGLVILMR